MHLLACSSSSSCRLHESGEGVCLWITKMRVARHYSRLEFESVRAAVRMSFLAALNATTEARKLFENVLPFFFFSLPVSNCACAHNGLGKLIDE